MKPAEFAAELVDAYEMAQEPAKPHRRLSRGDGRLVASEMEDRLAYFLIEALPNCSKILIAQRFPLPGALQTTVLEETMAALERLPRELGVDSKTAVARIKLFAPDLA